MTVFLWMLIPALLAIGMHLNCLRHLLAYIPALAVVSVVGASEIIQKKAGKIFLSFLVLIGILQYFEFNYDIGLGLKNRPLCQVKDTIIDNHKPFFCLDHILKCNESKLPISFRENKMMLEHLKSMVRKRHILCLRFHPFACSGLLKQLFCRVKANCQASPRFCR